MKKAIIAAALAFSSGAMAVIPSPGLWWNPSQSGRGFSLDYQNGFLVITGFVYNQDGSATFVQAANAFDPKQNTFTATLNTVSGGQCLGCTYKAPTATSLGTFTMTFSGPESATITFPGGSDTLIHEIYGYADKLSYLYGEWIFDLNVLGVTSSQWVVFNTFAVENGQTFIDGVGDLQILQAAGSINPSNGHFLIAVNDNGGFTRVYDMPYFDDRRMVGLGGTAPIGSLPPLTAPAVGSHVLSQAELVATKPAIAAILAEPNAGLHAALLQAMMPKP